MPELMGDIHAEPKPGTALRNMMKEHHHLDEFMTMVKAKMDLDEKYLGELKTIRDSCNPEWNESGAWPLISPFLMHINNEIDQREKTATELNSRLTVLPDTPPPNTPRESDLDPLETLKSLEICYNQCEQSHQVISTPESITELKDWWNKGLSYNPSTRRAPVVSTAIKNLDLERTYRRAVVAQQTMAKHAAKWQTYTLPGVLEHHQQRAEDTKSFLNVLFTYYSAVYSSLSISCSAAFSSTRAFSSSEFIAPRHDETEEEASHSLLRAVDYHNYMRDGEVTQPIFGLGVEKTVSLVNELLNYGADWINYYSSYLGWFPPAMELEKAAIQSEISALLERSKVESQKSMSLYRWAAFLMDEPVLPLPRDIVTQYRNSISRAKLSSLMATHLPLARQEVVTLMVRITDHLNVQYSNWQREYLWSQMAIFLSHNITTAPIIASIWRKWDIVNDCPFPDGVERVWSGHGEKSEVVWKKTGSPYYSPVSNSSD